MSEKEARRRELGAFLRSRRQRIDPRSVGLPEGRRRRTMGLRREEVAVLAGLSPTWYTYLEQGRDINPSSGVLDSIARMLQLDEDERSYIHRLVHGQQPARPVQADAPGKPVAEALLWQIAEAYPSYPVYVINMLADILAWNAAATEWYTDFARIPVEHRNTAWWVLVDPEARERLPKWEDEARVVISRLRAIWAVRPGDQRLAKLVADLHEVSPEMRRWWSRHEINSPAPCIRWLRHPRHGTRAMRVVVVYPAGADGMCIAFHLPVAAGGA